ELIPPLELARIRVQRNERGREQVRPRAHFGVEIRGDIAYGYEQRRCADVGRIVRPARATAMLRAFGVLPGVGACLVASRDEFERPDRRAVSDLERHHPTADAP